MALALAITITDIMKHEHPGLRIKREFIQSGKYTQKQLASEMGYSPATISHFLAGHATMTIPMAIALAQVLGDTAQQWIDRQLAHSLEYRALRAARRKSAALGI